MQTQQTWVAVRQPVWIHKNQQFVKGIIKQIYKDIVTCTLENGDSIKIKRHEIYHRNPIPIQSSRTDLMQNDIINQPQILQHLSQRFLNKKIYTFVQNTLIAVNPYSPIPDLYTQQVKESYITNIIENSGNIKDQQPHIYAITAEMVKLLFEQKRDQAIIISGESGAGKTEVNKQCLRFLATYFAKQHLKDSNIQKAIMLSNPILEAFGNSKTIRNNNSSRFGKYLSIMIDSNTKEIKHAQIYNYLLQKSRIISRSKQEQNFHIFYEFLIKTTTAQKVKYFLIDQQTNKQLTFQNFNYTKNQSQTEYKAQQEISFQKIKISLTILPDPKSYDYLCRILSAVLHLGNLEPFQDQNSDYCEIRPKEVFSTVCYLLQVDKKLFYDSLTSYNVKIGGQQLQKHFSKRQVQQLIHSLSKTLYQRLFQWIINQLNKSIKSKIEDIDQQLLSLGFLDIYGFQVLKMNSLEQLFINYTNERLHQIYLQKIFKLERQNFKNQHLQHKFRQVEFQDNIKVIQLIDYDQLSIFNLLDQWCSVASPDEGTLITKIRFNHKKHQKFPSSNLNLLSTQFVIRHTPQDIQYSVVGFRQKNKDLLREQIKNTMKSSNIKILNTMFTEPKVQNQADSKDHKIRKFLSSKFRKQMNELILDLLDKTQQHFIRCIKSNGNKKPLEIEHQIVYSQIKYLGILDTIKIKKMGYCIKLKYEDIDKRFPWLVRRIVGKQCTQQEAVASLKNFLPKFGQEQMLYGSSKVFFRDYSFNILMKKYSKHVQYLQKKAHLIASIFIKIRYINKRNKRKKYKQILNKYVRSFLQSRTFRKMGQNIQKIQKIIRSFLAQRSSAKKLDSIIVLQSYIKRSIETKLRIKRTNMIQKVILRFKYLFLRKKVRSRLIANYIFQNHIFDKAWNDLKNKNTQVISRYVHGLGIKITKKDKILQAIKNQRNAIEGRSLSMIQEYLVGFSVFANFSSKRGSIRILQSNIRTFLIRKKFQILRTKIILVQKCIREYLFRKKGAKRMFEKTYSKYEQQLKNQNTSIQNRLYDSEIGQAIMMNTNIYKFLNKFKQKISLIYFIIDLQTFVDLQILYPNKSWISNYLQIFQEGLEKNDPIQYLQVGETFTIAASTSKSYLWGMHDDCRRNQYESIFTKKSKIMPESITIQNNKIVQKYPKQDENQRKNQNRYQRRYSTINKQYRLQNGKLFQRQQQQFKLIKQIGVNQRVLEISCGKAHTVFRTSLKKVYSFGNGRQGQLGHSSFNSEQRPRLIKFFDNIKTSFPIQVSATFTSTIVLLSNHKMYWFGKNGTIPQISTPILLDLKSKCQVMNNSDFSIGRILSTWSRTMSVIGVTVICYNKKFENNIALRNKTMDILFTRWQQAGIYNINPPVIPSVSDHLQQCHVKLKNRKINIHPQSKTVLKQMQQKVKSIASITSGGAPDAINNRNSIGTQFSFANTQHNSIFK